MKKEKEDKFNLVVISYAVIYFVYVFINKYVDALPDFLKLLCWIISTIIMLIGVTIVSKRLCKVLKN